MNISTYNTILTNRRTIVVVDNGQSYSSGLYRESRIRLQNGQMEYCITDGFNVLQDWKPVRNNLKSAINIVQGHITPLPWYAS